MKAILILSLLVLGNSFVPAHAQDANIPGLGEVVVTANRSGAPYAQQDRPVVGLRRRADSLVTVIAFNSDSRDAETRKREIHAMMRAAIDRAPAAGIELVTGSFDLQPVTAANYQTMPLISGGRVDTSRVNLMLKAKLTGTADAASQKLDSFAKGIPRSGRGTIDSYGGTTLTIVNPDQYRDAIIKMVADDATTHAATFGPNYAVQVTGIDGQVSWSQVSSTDVFLYVPYRYIILPK
jgi:hypothetical protein